MPTGRECTRVWSSGYHAVGWVMSTVQVEYCILVWSSPYRAIERVMSTGRVHQYCPVVTLQKGWVVDRLPSGYHEVGMNTAVWSSG